ncbi:hypothetical protein YP76_25435 [Sphingobium chungbukense]|uniref:Uncharacterized protein n=1 Tax=Sphingobium chungbukense TaxID=56193 RepID=A0A0M3AKE6_9SPHN|nr:hypothetical protein YP76_25435 [Sphingobium chungbukense]
MPNPHNGKNAQHITSLADAAMVSACGRSAEAAILLLDAALAIALTMLGARADEMAGYLAEYLVQQCSHVTGGAGNA